MSGGSHNYIADTINEALFEGRIWSRYANVCDAKNARIARNLNPMNDVRLNYD